jgi:uncharacterized protein (TIGR00290 family)
MIRKKIVFCWSGGKDSALALHEIQKSGEYEIAALLTTMADDFDRVCMHGVRGELLDRQADALGIPLHKIYVPRNPTNKMYEEKMESAFKTYRDIGIQRVGFGDIFLEDLKEYRDGNLSKLGMTGLYPLWKRATKELINAFIRTGFKAVVACVDLKVLDPSFAGRMIDDAFVAELPKNADPCGENGEFHSFVYDGPIFHSPVTFSLGKRHTAEGFCFCDLVPASRITAPAEGPS